MICLEDALGLLLTKAKKVGTEAVPLAEAAGRVLAQDVVAEWPLPPFTRSPLDGYAVLSADTRMASKGNPVELRVVEEIGAGWLPQRFIESGHAAKVMTGAPLPAGADAVIKYEDVTAVGDKIYVSYPVDPWSNVSKAGEDVLPGELVMEAGMVLGAAEIGVLAALGVEKVLVFCRPEVAVISTGDELMPLGEPLRPGKIYDSNLYCIGAAVQECGGKVVFSGTVGDDRKAIYEKIAEAASLANLILTTGGVSVGDRDLVKSVLQGLGAEILFWRVNIKPGMPVVAAVLKDGQVLIGLSGNPAAALISFELLVRPLIYLIGGRLQIERPRVSALLDEGFGKRSSVRRFLRARAYVRDGQLHVTPWGKQNPGAIRSLSGCNALIDVPAGTEQLRAGQIVNIVMLSLPTGECQTDQPKLPLHAHSEPGVL